MIEFDEVTKTYGEGAAAVRAVHRLSFSVPAGTFCAIMGPSGSGKSTVLNLIAGLTRATSGRVLIEGRDVGSLDDDALADLRRCRVGYVLQSFNLLPFLTAAENVAAPLMIDHVRAGQIERRVKQSLDWVGMAHRAEHKATDLSGGEQQRIAIARALVIEPAVVLADEPTGNLDQTTARAVMDLIASIHKATGVTILLVTHDPTFAARAARTIRIIDGAVADTSDRPA